MPRQVTYSYARQNLAEVLDEAQDGRQPIVIRRRNHEDMALIPAAELRGLEETAHLLRSPKNTQRLLTALRRALDNTVAPSTARQLSDELGLT